MALEKAGIKTFTIVCNEFYKMAAMEARVLGVPSLSIVEIPYPVGELDSNSLNTVVQGAFRKIKDLLAGMSSTPKGDTKVSQGYFPDVVTLQGASDIGEQVYEFLLKNGLGDGLPIIAPTRERVERMLSFVGATGDVVVGRVPPSWAEATVESIAANAVMAGCKPEYFPVVLAMVRAALAPEFNLYGIQATTNPVTPMTVIDGPIAKELHLNSGYGLFGPGYRSNAVIGRALRLVMLNIGGGIPGEMDYATHGQSGKYTMCIAENEDATPWELLHVERGYEPDVSTVTVIAVSTPQNIIDVASTRAEDLLNTIVAAGAVPGSNCVHFSGQPVLILGPEHARVLSKCGYTKQDIKTYLWEKGGIPLNRYSAQENQNRFRERAIRGRTGEYVVPIAPSPEDIIIIVAGGMGKHSQFAGGFDSRSVTLPIVTHY